VNLNALGAALLKQGQDFTPELFDSMRTFAQSALACGSMAWYFTGFVYRFLPSRTKNDTHGIEHDRQAKVLIML
jgi:hypothetical protein